MKKRTTILFLLFIFIFFFGMSSVIAETKRCNMGGSMPVCVYEKGNSVFKITACYNEDNVATKYFFYFPTKTTSGFLGIGKKQYFISQEPENILYGNLDYNHGSSMNSNGIKKLYLSTGGYNSVIAAGKDHPEYGGASSSKCPKYVSINEDFTNVCIADNKDYCADASLNMKWTFSEMKKTDYVDSVKVAQNRANSNNDMQDFEEYIGQKIEIGEVSCDSILGRIDSKDAPAYYLDLLFTAIKYAAIIILVVFSMLDYVKAVVGKDDDAMSKANSKFLKRLVTCIIIFLAPILINEILSWANIVDTATSCSIGGLK